MLWLLTKLWLYLLYALRGAKYTKDLLRDVIRRIEVDEQEERQKRLEDIERERKLLENKGD